MKFQSFFSAVFSILLISSFCCDALQAQDLNSADHVEKQNNRRKSEHPIDAVASAFAAESNGDLEKRTELLLSASESRNGDFAKSYLGQVNIDGKWLTIDQCIAEAKKSKKLQEYQQRRGTLESNIENNLVLANWALQEGLREQAKAHLERVIDIEPDHRFARETLGYRQVNNEWISPAEITKFRMSVKKKQESVRRHGKKIDDLVRRLDSKRSLVRESARKELLEIKDAGAVGAVESALASESIECSRLAIEWMGQIDTVEASEVLLRYAMLHPKREVQEFSIEKLAHRPKHDFVPELLKSLSSLITQTIVPIFDNQGFVEGYQQAFAREDFDSKEFVTFDRRFVFDSSMNAGNATANGFQQQVALLNETTVINRSRGEMQGRTQTMEEQNEEIEERNSLIAEIISKISGQPFTNSPKQMWSWWDAYNETEYQSFKPERYQTETLTTREADFGRGGIGRGDCFVAGTPVLTCNGFRKIEEITTGDLVLSRNISSGMLCWNPVISPTVRPTGETISVVTDDQTLRCSKGHLFWVSGTGWKKASELNVGDVLHGAEQPAVITAINEEKPVQTHNLEVANNANYFVGKNLVMTHDVTPRISNRQKVPGEDYVRHQKAIRR